MNTSRIRTFLLQQPKPAFVRVTADGDTQEVKVGRSYARLAETIDALGPDLLEALDKDKGIIRAMRLDTQDAQRSAAAEMPEALKADPQAALITHFANLLHRAYEHSTEIAFSKLVEVFDRVNERSDSIEKRLERTEAMNRQMLQDQVDDAFDRAAEVAEQAGAKAEGSDLVSQMASAFMAGRGVKAAPNGAGGAH